MPIQPTTGRNRSGLIGKYVRDVTEPDDLPDGVTLTDGTYFFKCAMEGCKTHAKGKVFQASRWYRHLVCDCNSDEMTDRKRLTLAVKTTQTDVVRWNIYFRN